jgi:hypothetical protein
MSYTKQELEDAEVVTMTVSEAREADIDHEPLLIAIDVAQGSVFTGDTKRALVIIEIVANKS